MGRRDHRVTVGFALDDNDTLVEEYSGVRLRFETRHIGTERVAASLEASWLNNTWRAPTLAALEADPRVPEPYRQRITVEPALTVALTRHVRASGGVSLSSLESLHQLPRLADGERRHRRRSSTASGGTATGAPGRPSRPATSCGRRSTGSAATSTTRGTSDGRATSSTSRHNTASSRRCSAAASPAQAPLFERFTLGDSATLRGWNKFELAPIGGNRVFHQSLEYRFHGAALFLDAGSVWDDGAPARAPRLHRVRLPHRPRRSSPSRFRWTHRAPTRRS